MEDNKPTQTVSTITEKDRQNITDVVFVLQTFSVDHFHRVTYPNTNTVGRLIKKIDSDKDEDFKQGSLRAIIAVAFLQEFEKIERITGAEEARSYVNRFMRLLGEKDSNLPRLNQGAESKDFTNQQLENALVAIATACDEIDKETSKSSRTEFRKVFSIALDLPDLAPSPSEVRTSSSYWKPLGVSLGVVIGGSLTAGLIYDSQQNWAVCHAIASHPQISAPVVTVLFLAFVAGCYGYYKSKGKEEGNTQQPSLNPV